ncbi:MAG: SAM-dependent methyltransferase [Alphaproteobacteria bacterium]|nr:SAM-dependent methyltransferase [Alphaproteobacteria bacterium]
MRLCLFHYYRTHVAIGAAADFITAPEVSQMFGELIGLWTAELWAALDRPTSLCLVELGPGRGTLMADALRATARVAPDFRAAVDLHLVEVNPELRRRQAEVLGAAQPRWHDDIATLPPGPAIVVANEFLDALPIDQVVRTETGWRQRVIDSAEGRLVFAQGGPVEAPAAAPVGSVFELAPERERIAARLFEHVATEGGAALIIDYGSTSALGDSLQAVRAHEKVDPLAEPGEADLTAHVDFSRLLRLAGAAGVTAHGPVPQGAFLRRLGIAARAATLLRTASPAQKRTIEQAMRRLIEPDEMGTLFQALAVTAPGLPIPPGFNV